MLVAHSRRFAPATIAFESLAAFVTQALVHASSPVWQASSHDRSILQPDEASQAADSLGHFVCPQARHALAALDPELLLPQDGVAAATRHPTTNTKNSGRIMERASKVGGLTVNELHNAINRVLSDH
jgi:hypothetical protein